jgi:hypothetical protein
MSSINNSKFAKSDTAYWIRKDKEDYIKELFAVHKHLMPKIKKDDWFTALSSIPNLSSIPWPLYVMALTRSLNPATKPSFCDLPIDDMNCTVMSVAFSTIDQSILNCRIVCNICRLTFLPCVKDMKGDPAIRDVSALYKLHKSADRLDNYPLCSACFFALQNPAVALDYPKQNRKDPVNQDYYINNFQMLKRESNFGYCGQFIVANNMISYIVPDHALTDSIDGEDPDVLNIHDFAG